MVNADQVTAAVIAAWQSSTLGRGAKPLSEPLPEPEVLKTLIANAFEASLLREENRPLTFRLLVCSPDRFAEAPAHPTGLHRLLFHQPRPLTPQELRRLTPAIDHDHSLVGVYIDQNREAWIWGIVHSGSQWLQRFYGGRSNALSLPDSLIVGVYAPGYLLISQGSRPLCSVEGGLLQSGGLNVFDSVWFPAEFATVRQELLQRHAAARRARGAHWANIDPDFTRMVARQMIQRLISTIQLQRHGGTLLIVPSEIARQLTQPNSWMKLKYKFVGEEPQARVRSLVLKVMNTLAALETPPHGETKTVGWDDYGRAGGRELNDLDEAIFETAHMIAMLTAVDGAVVVTPRFEVLGFGGEIGGALTEVPFVARALNLEGTSYRIEPTEDVGTRHRSVYRIVNALPGVLAIVVSQDGGARFIRRRDPYVMYWNHSTITPS